MADGVSNRTAPWLLAVACAFFTGCAAGAQILARPDDLADYRAFRMARHEGERLACAQAYLRRHPHGAWAAQVRLVFDAEEAAWFESAKVSRSRARDYVVDLPSGPHAEAARALLVYFDEEQDDIDTLELLAAARHTAAMLDAEADRRKLVGDRVLEELASLVDPPTWGARLDEPPPLLADVLRGAVPRTWSGTAASHREDELFFVVPTPEGAEARVVEVRFQLLLSRGQVAEGRIAGEDLFVRWAEAMEKRVLDPTADADRKAASTTVGEVLAGALEARMPVARCAVPPEGSEILVRGCDGWGVAVTMGAHPGDDDVVAVRGPKVESARPPGMR